MTKGRRENVREMEMVIGRIQIIYRARRRDTVHTAPLSGTRGHRTGEQFQVHLIPPAEIR